jgi:hypothetical protein
MYENNDNKKIFNIKKRKIICVKNNIKEKKPNERAV